MENIENIKSKLNQDLENVTDIKSLMELSKEYLGKKGPIAALTSTMGSLSIEEKKELGIKLNELRTYINNLVEEKKQYFEEQLINERIEKETIDITLPSKKVRRGTKHPLTKVTEMLEDLFVSMGYDVVDGPEIESDENCFQRLNLPQGHPARDAQDTFYLEDEVDNYLLRTHTSSLQVRTMLKNEEKKPIRIVCPGKTFRRDDDATHSHQFMQFEGLVIGEDISLADLKGALEMFARKLLGDNIDIRFRPSYFPFTEPSVEVDISCFKCGGKGCNLCKQTGWIEVLGAGIVHPNVLRMNGYDPEKYTGFAFGPGLDRFAMFKYEIDNIKSLYTNDYRFLKQFDRKDDGHEVK